jgi:lipid-A-disaccharide synthase
MTTRIAMAAGESSGDLLAALVLPALREALPDIECGGIAGDRMAAAGCDPWFHVRELSVRGYAEVLRHLPRLLRLRSRFMRRVRQWPAQLYVGVDAPDFNLGVEARLRPAGIRTVQYVSPAVWAWRPERIVRIRSAVDHMLCLFPFERGLLSQAGIRATYVGHPLASAIAHVTDPVAARKRLGLDPHRPVVALLPGSRPAEVAALAPPFFAAAGLLASDQSLQFVVPVAEPSLAPSLHALRARGGFDRIVLVAGRSHDCLEAADAVMVAAGTATLEAMLFKRPMVIAYKVPRLTERITLRRAVIPYIGLPNVLAGRYTVPELLQEAVEPLRLAELVRGQLEGSSDTARLRDLFDEQHQALMRDTPRLVAAAIVDTLESRQ